MPTVTRRLRKKLMRLHAYYEKLAELAACGDEQARALLLDLGMRLFALKREIETTRLHMNGRV